MLLLLRLAFQLSFLQLLLLFPSPSLSLLRFFFKKKNCAGGVRSGGTVAGELARSLARRPQHYGAALRCARTHAAALSPHSLA
jgi:hypothetical protein